MLKKGDFFIIQHDKNSDRKSFSGVYEVEEIKNGFVYYIESGKIRFRNIEDCIKYEV